MLQQENFFPTENKVGSMGSLRFCDLIGVLSVIFRLPVFYSYSERNKGSNRKKGSYPVKYVLVCS